MPPPALPQQSASSALSSSSSAPPPPPPTTQANININVSCADDSSTAESSLEDGKDFLAGLGGGAHPSPVYGQAVNTAAVDGLKVLALLWVCIANFYLLGYQPQMLPSVGKCVCLYLYLSNSRPVVPMFIMRTLLPSTLTENSASSSKCVCVCVCVPN